MKCKKCGFETPDNSNFCSHCGEKIDFDDVFINAEQAYQKDASKREQPDSRYFKRYREEDLRTNNRTASIGWYFLGFFVPILGFILASIYSYKMPDMARKCRLGAFHGIILELAMYMIYFIIAYANK